MTNSGAIAYTPVSKEKSYYFFCQGVGFLWIFFVNVKADLCMVRLPLSVPESGGVPPHSNVKLPADV